MKYLAVFFCCLAASARLAFTANVLSNPGFESDPQGSTSTINGWTSYSASGSSTYSETGAPAHGGTNYFKVYQSFNGSVNYNGIYQDYISGPGATYSASGWGYTSSGDTLAGQNVAWIEVTFRDAAANIISLYRSASVTASAISAGTFPKNTWVNLAVTNQFNPITFQLAGTVTSLVAPAGTSFVRYQVVFQGDAASSGGSLYFDDLDLNQTAGLPFGNWGVVWSDEFNGTSINTGNWSFDIGNGSDGWGNGELEYYTSSSQNAYVTNGLLHIVARKQSDGGFSYTSARMKTIGLFSQEYGRFEFSASLPTGQGYWPALWMMPESSVYGAWAASGEIDVMECMGGAPSNILGTIHFGGVSPDNTQSYGPSYTLLPGDTVTNLHTYLVDWTTNAISWYVDGHLYETQTNWYTTGGTYPAPFNEPFYIVMNVAVGGNFGGNPNGSTVFPGEMDVDYVRVYEPGVVSPPPQPLQYSSVNVSGGNVVMSGTNGAPNTTYYVMATMDLTQPLAAWIPVSTNETTSSGTFSDTFSLSSPASFYRIETP